MFIYYQHPVAHDFVYEYYLFNAVALTSPRDDNIYNNYLWINNNVNRAYYALLPVPKSQAIYRTEKIKIYKTIIGLMEQKLGPWIWKW